MARFRFKTIPFIIFALLLCVMWGCKTAATTANSREITDDLGRKVKLPVKVERVVSLAPSLTETIFAVGGGDRLVGVTSFCDFPAETSNIQKVGDTLNPNVETIIALKPDVVFITTASQLASVTTQFERHNIPVFVTNPEDIEGVYRGIFHLGDVFGETDNARNLVAALKKRAAVIEARTVSAKKIKVFVQISKEPLFTVGKKSFITDLIRRAGGVSVTADVNEAYPKFSKETALALQPEAIILSESEDNKEPNDVFKNSPAIKNGQVFKINSDIISRPSPRLIDALEQIGEKLHP